MTGHIDARGLREPLVRPFRVLLIHGLGGSDRTAALHRRQVPELLAVLRLHCATSPELEDRLRAVGDRLAEVAGLVAPGEEADEARQAAARSLSELKAGLLTAAPSDESERIWKAGVRRRRRDD